MAMRCANRGWKALKNAEPIYQSHHPQEVQARMTNQMLGHWVEGEELATRYEEAIERLNPNPPQQPQAN